MIVPNKVIKFEDSIIGKIQFILKEMKDGKIDIKKIYYNNIKNFEDINDFIIALDVLYILDVIKYNEEEGEYYYVEADFM
ncbi:MAG TPA: hypothetical protein PK924_06175 [Bacilli bacterium]|jgi:hypothetical protein|nr:hypothetical protein [Bacilli bacterium]